MSERVSVQVRDGIADVRLSRPEKLNALDAPMFEALVSAGERVGADRSVRCVVLSGEGRSFCAGLDFQSFMQMAGGSEGGASLVERVDASPANRAQRAAWVWQEVAVPVVAAVHGVAFGGGLQVALAADLRLVSPDARLSVMEVKWGLIPDMTGSQTLRRLVRLDVAKELTFTGRIVSGAEAVELGLATRACTSPRDEAFELARTIANKSPDAIRAAKRLLNSAEHVSLEEGFYLEEQLQLSLIGSPNQVEAVQANLQKRDPSFSNPEA